jgi:hypothetical protein
MNARQVKRSSRNQFWLLLIIAFLPYFGSVNANASMDAVAHGVNYFGNDPCGDQNPLGWVCCDATTYLGQWDDSFENDFGYDGSRLVENEDVRSSYWIDGQNDGVYFQGVDTADAILFVGHGSHNCNGADYYTDIVMGYSSGSEQCYPKLTSTDEYSVSFGNGGDYQKAKIFISKSCQSAQYCVWKHQEATGAYAFDSMRGGAQFNIFNGHHGTAFSSGNDAEIFFHQYLKYSDNDDIGRRWVTNMTWRSKKNPDVCAVTITWGDDQTESDDIFFNGGFKDFKTSGLGSYRGFYFEEGCEPEDGQKLPDSSDVCSLDDDQCRAMHCAAAELCNGIDDNCDGIIPDNEFIDARIHSLRGLQRQQPLCLVCLLLFQ